MRIVFLLLERCYCYFEDFFKSIEYTIKNKYPKHSFATFLYKNVESIRPYISKNDNCNNVFILIKDITIGMEFYDSPIKTSKAKLFIFNSEQLTRNNFLNSTLKYAEKYPILDYSTSNILLLGPEKCKCLPYQVNYDEIKNYPKINDVAIVGYMSKYRQFIVKQLKDWKVNITCCNGFGQQRDNKLLRYKILVNVHCEAKFAIFEEIRCNRLIANKIIIVSEKSKHLNPFLKKFVIEADYDDLAKTVKETIDNYDKVYSKIYGNFDLQTMDNYYSGFISRFTS